MIVSKGNLTQDSLKGEVALVTGAGRGIGFEAARALIWLGANVIIAEIDEKNGKAAEDTINKEFALQKLFSSKQILATKKTSTNCMMPPRKNSAKLT